MGEQPERVDPAHKFIAVTNALYKRIIRKEMDLPLALEALEVILAFGIEIHEEVGSMPSPGSFPCNSGSRLPMMSITSPWL